MNTKYTPGNLVRYRNRDWMVLPSNEDQIILVKPLGGSDEETTGIFLPLAKDIETLEKATFKEPNQNQIGNFETAKLLYNASRLSLRNAAGPFRSMGKLSFRPRSYQVVPLVMALKQEITRLLIADDVGIGKTIEALLIIKELIERGEIKRFAVICPPHLCEQWQQELKDKLDIDAEIIRSSTASRLDRMVPDDRSVFYHIPYQVISVDYIKIDKRRGIFLNDCPELVIVDEAHTCTLPKGASSKNQQQRYNLIHDIASNKGRHLLLLTATPHSGKDEEFLSLLGLLNPAFEKLNFEKLEQSDRRKIAQYFIQRKRENIRRWLNEETLFPDRDSKEVGFTLSEETKAFYNELVSFARGISDVETDNENTRLLRSWAAIALIKGAMSSPAMAKEMLEKRQAKLALEDNIAQVSLEAVEDTLFEENDFGVDFSRSDLLNAVDYKTAELEGLSKLLTLGEFLNIHTETDLKIKHTIDLIKKWLKEGFQPIIFCHYIATAKYVEEKLKEVLPKNIQVQAITSELADEQRKEEIQRMGEHEKRVLVATDCLSEGINLQDHFNAVLHYDLPWNPNRIEQREGRVDRFGQASKSIKTYMLYGENNPMDKFILEVLIRKVREIQKSIGVTIPIGENNKSLMAELTQKILKTESETEQLILFAEEKIRIDNELEMARKKGENLRSIFAQESVDAEAIKKDLQEVDEAIGDPQAVESFTVYALQSLGASVNLDNDGYNVQITNLPKHLQIALLSKTEQLKGKTETRIAFASPTPKGYQYVGRNHRFVEQLCHYIVSNAFEEEGNAYGMARTSVIQTESVQNKTTMVMFRVRNVVKEVRSKNESVAEEMYLWGYTEDKNGLQSIDFERAQKLLNDAVPLSNLPLEQQKQILKIELNSFENKKDAFVEIATRRADKLVEAHGRFKTLIGGRSYEKSTPVLPPDVMGVYILLPKPKALF
ncbi:helicase-related protein [Flavobacterium sp. CLA17]|uniref:helicase-related protein n=1 Tax=Flavobacterium sp. CLA17 TaxID=2724135 RepID=UPI001491AEBD|nr:helicase-related protein [Flavobacterium sp. CLA17]QSB25246.1 DEAD/DEAH box helicase [Flavobacterium sp. CLA17]